MRRSAARAVIVFLVPGALALGCAGQASAQPATIGADQGFCTAVLDFDTAWPQVNLDVPGQPFFSDGNNDKIADLLQVGHAKLPSLASDLETLAGDAPSGVQSGLRTLATAARTLAKDPTPTTAAQSSQQTGQIQQAATAVQRDLTATGCPAKVKAANAAADQATAGSSGSDDQGRTWAAIILFLIVNIPLIRRVLRHSRRPALRGDGSGFKGNLRRWKVDTSTGRVLNVQRGSVTSAYAAGPIGVSGRVPVSSTTTTTETVRLALTDGRQRDFTLINFSASPTIGDVVTICVGRKGSREVTFTLLNHTTRGEIVQLQGLFKLREGGSLRQSLFFLGLILSSVVTVFICVFVGAPWLLVVWVVLIVMFAVGSRREASIDLQPLWHRASAEVEPLRA